jgi:LPS export ABC transporter protein LptC
MNSLFIHKNFITAILLGCIFLCSCENNETAVKNLTNKKIGIEEAQNIELKYSVNGKSKAIVHAPLMYTVQEKKPYMEFTKTLHADFFNENEIKESTLDAQYAKYNQNESVVFLKGSVTVINISKGDTLFCEELYWDRQKTGHEFYTDKPVKIRTKTETINGKGLDASQDFKNWHIIQTIGTISVPAAKFPL